LGGFDLKKGLSIQFKILALLLSLIIIPTTVNAFVSFQFSSNTLGDEIKNSLGQTTEYIEDTLDLFFKNYEQGITILGDNQNIKTFLLRKQESVDAMDAMEVYQKNHSEIQSIFLGTPKKEFFVFPKQQVPAGFDPTSRPWYQDAVNKNAVIWTEPYKDTGSGKLVVTVAKPVFDDSNNIIGVIGADLSLDKLTSMIVSFNIGEKGYFILTDTKGNIIAHPTAEKIGQPLATDILLKKAQSNEISGILDYNYNNADKHTNFTTIERTGWKLFGTFDYTEITNKTRVILQGSLMSTLLLILVAGFLAFFLSRPIIKGIKSVSNDMLTIGNGNFTVRSQIKSKDEIGMLSATLNKMAQELGSIMANVKSMASEVSSSSNSLAASSEESTATTDEISRTIQEIVRVTEDQAFNTEDGLKKTTQLADKIQGVSLEINRIASMVSDSSTLNEKGVKSVAVLKEASDASNAASYKVSAVIAEVDKSSGQIGVIVDTMSNIADQTNMLALNASIEAARAGESGRGFAVVADQIRKLAEQSASASNDIRKLANNIQAQSKNAVTTMDETKPVVAAQNNAVAETKAIFDQISKTILSLTDEVAVISELNDSMVQKKDEILSTMESISASAEETSASTEQIAASTHEQLAASDEVAKTAEQLNHVAQKLSEEVSRFKI
jgi:methyl-accepting chemotaxis protein